MPGLRREGASSARRSQRPHERARRSFSKTGPRVGPLAKRNGDARERIVRLSLQGVVEVPSGPPAAASRLSARYALRKQSISYTWCSSA
jgi:hypothetical protein